MAAPKLAADCAEKYKIILYCNNAYYIVKYMTTVDIYIYYIIYSSIIPIQV